MKIGAALRLDRDAGELFADARAIEAAGAHSLWVARSRGSDGWTLLAAFAAATSRIGLAALDLEDRTEARAAVEALSRGRLLLAQSGGEEIRLVTDGEPERWRRLPFPNGRAHWREIRAREEAAGIAGIVLENDPRLLDLLRNPDVDDDRADLRISVG